MTTEKRIELAAMFLARCIDEPLDIRASGDTRKKLCMYALAWADALAEVAEGDKPKTRYDWGKAPKWAQWASTDRMGRGDWWSNKPWVDLAFNVWTTKDCGKYEMMERKRIKCEDWRDSLEARPNA